MTLPSGDVNGDSYLDVIEGNWNHANKIYLNDKTGHFNFFSDITSDADATGVNTGWRCE